jgi:hypothetical protein
MLQVIKAGVVAFDKQLVVKAMRLKGTEMEKMELTIGDPKDLWNDSTITMDREDAAGFVVGQVVRITLS